MDFSDELSRIRAARAARKPKRFSKSRLDKYNTQILKLKKEGASLSDIQFWLREKKVVVAVSTISRWLKKNV